MISVSWSQLTVKSLGLVLSRCTIYNVAQSFIEWYVVLFFFYSIVFFVKYFGLSFNFDRSFVKAIPVFIWRNDRISRELKVIRSILLTWSINLNTLSLYRTASLSLFSLDFYQIHFFTFQLYLGSAQINLFHFIF